MPIQNDDIINYNVLGFDLKLGLFNNLIKLYFSIYFLFSFGIRTKYDNLNNRHTNSCYL